MVIVLLAKELEQAMVDSGTIVIERSQTTHTGQLVAQAAQTKLAIHSGILGRERRQIDPSWMSKNPPCPQGSSIFTKLLS